MRDRVFALTFWPWYGLFALLGAIGSYLIVLGDMLGALVVEASATSALSAALWEIQARRDERVPLRRELLGLAMQRAGQAAAWLNRGEHVTFSAVQRGWLFRYWDVTRADQALSVELWETGRVVATIDIFRVMPGSPKVPHLMTGGMLTRDGHEGPPMLVKLPAEGSRVRRARGRSLGRRSGLMTASAADLREVVAQFRDAEPVGAA